MSSKRKITVDLPGKGSGNGGGGEGDRGGGGGKRPSVFSRLGTKGSPAGGAGSGAGGAQAKGAKRGSKDRKDANKKKKRSSGGGGGKGRGPPHGGGSDGGGGGHRPPSSPPSSPAAATSAPHPHPGPSTSSGLAPGRSPTIDPDWENWDEKNLDHDDERMLEKKRQLLQRELAKQLQQQDAPPGGTAVQKRPGERPHAPAGSKAAGGGLKAGHPSRRAPSSSSSSGSDSDSSGSSSSSDGGGRRSRGMYAFFNRTSFPSEIPYSSVLSQAAEPEAPSLRIGEGVFRGPRIGLPPPLPRKSSQGGLLRPLPRDLPPCPRRAAASPESGRLPGRGRRGTAGEQQVEKARGRGRGPRVLRDPHLPVGTKTRLPRGATRHHPRPPPPRESRRGTSSDSTRCLPRRHPRNVSSFAAKFFAKALLLVLFRAIEIRPFGSRNSSNSPHQQCSQG